MRFLLVYHPGIPDAQAIAETVAKELEALGEREIRLCSVDALQPEVERPTDMVLTFGGDGTIIHTAAHFVDSQTPILGINLGTVGFLCHLEVQEVKAALPALLSGDYALEARTVLKAEIYENERRTERAYCINELCVKASGAHMIDFQVVIDGELHSRFRGDGMLVASPTGSTAYSLSAGGPVVDPELEVILLTPLVSYLLSKKSLVVSGRHEICLLGSVRQETLVAVDGRETRLLNEPFRILLRQAENRMLLVNLHRRSFFASVEKRLGQNAAP